MGGKVFGSVLVAVEDVEVVTIDLNVAAHWHVCWGDELQLFVNILILSSLQEWSLNNTRVLLGWLEDGDGVVGKIEGDDESSVNILWHFSVESCGVSKDLLIIVYILEEINLWFLWHQVIHVTKGVHLVSESIVWWHLYNDSWSWLWLLNTADWEVPVVFLKVVVLGEFVNTSDFENSSICSEAFFAVDFIAGQISVTDELLSRLVHVESLGQSLSSEVYGEGVSSVIREVNLSDLDGVVRQEVMPLELQVTTLGVESEDLSVVI